VPCNALWDDPEDSFQALAARLDGEGGE